MARPVNALEVAREHLGFVLGNERIRQGWKKARKSKIKCNIVFTVDSNFVSIAFPPLRFLINSFSTLPFIRVFLAINIVNKRK